MGRILFLTNNDISKTLVNWLINSAGEEVLIFNGKISIEMVELYNPDLLVSYNYKTIISKAVLEIMEGKAINLHTSFLPWNKGADPNLWSFLEDTPKGVTIHLIDEGIDTGDILLQEEIILNEDNETLHSSYLILHKVIQNLFTANWELIKYFHLQPKQQAPGGSIHYLKDFASIRHLLDNEGWHIGISELKKRYKNLKTASIKERINKYVH